MRKLLAVFIAFVAVAFTTSAGESRVVASADFTIECGAGGPQVAGNCEFTNTSGQAGAWCFSDWLALGGVCAGPSVTMKRWMQMGGWIDPGPYTTAVTHIVGADTVVKEVVCTRSKCREK
jgi:hypothetical protein